VFYHTDPDFFDVVERQKCVGVDMETAGLYAMAADYGVRALAILTVSDEIRKDPAKPGGRTFRGMTADERQTSLNEMIEIALETALKASGARISKSF